MNTEMDTIGRDNTPDLNNCIKAIITLCETVKMDDLPKPMFNVYTECIEAIKMDCKNLNDTLLLKFESILDFLHEQIHTGYWHKVPKTTCMAYGATSAVKAIMMVKLLGQDRKEVLEAAIKTIDLGLLLGAPFEDSRDLLSVLAKKLSDIMPLEYSPTNLENKSNKRPLESFEEYNKLKAEEIDVRSRLSVEEFVTEYLIPERPVKIQDCMNTWDACTKWTDVEYLINVAGFRSVPIELGKSYADFNWSQKLMPLKDFIINYILHENETVGYLAQHNLFEQIPELFQDIAYPPYCFVTRNNESISDEPEINFWLGPKKTNSWLHYDPRDNILAQVFGTKQVVLVSHHDSKYLYSYDSKFLSNTSRVDPLNPDLQKFPKFSNAKIYKCLLQAGEMLYIPKKWWHHVIALEKSCSVNFWWG